RIVVGDATATATTGEWLIPSEVNLAEWNEFVGRVNDDLYSAAARHCYLNGTKLTVLAGSGNPAPGYVALNGTTGAFKAAQFGAARSATSGLTYAS
ncbi:hypothetical protein, partial [Escherichia coli]|uniref:hypothetical protein n=1 Tax=Escherichia coli TaxID=562 RepID=UPI00198135B4